MITTRHTYNGEVKLAYQLHNRLMVWRPRLVMIQGVGFDAAGWEPVLKRLRRRFRLVIVDNRGVGGSDSSPSWYTVATMAADIIAVLDKESISTAHVLGVSLGGMVAQELAITRPERVDRLVLVSTTPGWPFTPPMPAPTGRLLALAPVLPRRTALRLQVENMVSSESISRIPDLVGRLIDYRRRSTGHDGRDSRRQLVAGATYVGGLRQLRIGSETLVLHGTADTVADPRNAAVLVKHIAGAEKVLFPDAGHLLFWEYPDEFETVVTRFLCRPAAAAARPENARKVRKGLLSGHQAR